MRNHLVVVVALIALLSAAAASADTPPGFTRAPRLEPAATFVAGKPIVVWCANTEYDWEQYGATNGEYGLATPGSSEMKLAPDACRYLRAKTPNPNGFGASLLVLVHEAIHDLGQTDEGVTDCAAVHQEPRVAVRFFHIKSGKQLRAVMANAWHYRDGEPPAYRTVC